VSEENVSFVRSFTEQWAKAGGVEKLSQSATGFLLGRRRCRRTFGDEWFGVRLEGEKDFCGMAVLFHPLLPTTIVESSGSPGTMIGSRQVGGL
jgi:hypothetical protein